MKNIALGTTSQEKQRILSECLEKMKESGEYKIMPCDVSSGIADQPLDEETTITGAINRAHNALESDPDSDCGIGLEAGLVEVKDTEYYLVCVCAVVEKDGEVHVGISGKTPLPIEVSRGIKNGESFGKLIREYHDACDSEAKKEWVLGLISRKMEFTDAINRAFFFLNI